ncbi:MAG: hypothetical protein JWO09_2713 [Bacteroidetes bacterium]|nr:hypothetical protein [Bacteroidota bacterium]
MLIANKSCTKSSEINFLKFRTEMRSFKSVEFNELRVEKFEIRPFLSAFGRRSDLRRTKSAAGCEGDLRSKSEKTKKPATK